MDPWDSIFRFLFNHRVLVGFKKSFLTKVYAITVFNKDIKEMGFLFIEAIFIRDSQGTSSEGVENAQLLSREMM